MGNIFLPKRQYSIWIVVLLTSFIGWGQESADVSTAYITWSPDGQYIAAAGTETIDIIEVVSGHIKHRFFVNRIVPSAAVWSSDGLYIGFSTGIAFEVWFSPINSPTLEAVFETYVGSRAAAWKPHGHFIAIADGPVTYIWDVNSQDILASFTTDSTSATVSGVEWGTEGKELYVSRGFVISAFNIEDETTLMSIYLSSYINSQGSFVNPYAVIALSPSQDRIAIASDDAVRIFNQDDFNQKHIAITHDVPFLGGHVGAVDSLSWHSDGRYLASGGADGTIRVWDTQKMEQIHVIDLSDNIYVKSVAWSPDGTLLAYGSPTGESYAISVSRNDILPITAHAGHDQIAISASSGAAQVTLDASASFDPDGADLSYIWTIDNIEIANGMNPAIALAVGEYQVKLTVIGNEGVSDSDMVKITVMPAVVSTSTIPASADANTPTAICAIRSVSRRTAHILSHRSATTPRCRSSPRPSPSSGTVLSSKAEVVHRISA